jgi:peroxiredoxin
MVTEGQEAPDFELTSDSGERVRLSQFRGRPVVLYFYPKDDTHASIDSNRAAKPGQYGAPGT